MHGYPSRIWHRTADGDTPPPIMGPSTDGGPDGEVLRITNGYFQISEVIFHYFWIRQILVPILDS